MGGKVEKDKQSELDRILSELKGGKKREKLNQPERQILSDFKVKKIKEFIKTNNKEELRKELTEKTGIGGYAAELGEIVSALGYEWSRKPIKGSKYSVIDIFSNRAGIKLDKESKEKKAANLLIRDKLINSLISGGKIDLTLNIDEKLSGEKNNLSNNISKLSEDKKSIKISDKLQKFINGLNEKYFEEINGMSYELFVQLISEMENFIKNQNIDSNDNVIIDLLNKLNILEEIKKKIDKLYIDYGFTPIITVDNQIEGQQELNVVKGQDSSVNTDKATQSKDENPQLVKAINSIAIPEIKVISFCKEKDIPYKINDSITRSFVENQIRLEELNRLKDTLPPEKKSELEKDLLEVNISVYKAAEKIGYKDTLKQIRGNEFYAEIEQKYAEIVVSEKTEFDEELNNKINKSPNPSYRSKLQGLLSGPELFDENVLDKSKFNFDEKLLSKFDENAEKNPEQFNPEKTKQLLKDESDIIMQRKFGENIMSFLQDIFDVKIDEKQQEDILEKFDGKNQTLKNKKLEIKGEINGKDINLVYNVETGFVSINKFFSREENQDNILLNRFKDIEGIKGPNLSDLKNVVQNKIDYKYIVESSKNIEEYKMFFENSMVIKMPKYDFNREKLQKEYLENLVGQEMLTLMNVDKSKLKDIDKNQKEYNIYRTIQNSLKNFDVNQLLKSRSLIQNYLKLKDQIDGKLENVNQDNQEQILIYKSQKEELNGNKLGLGYADFFDLIKNDRKGIIDLDNWTIFDNNLSLALPNYDQLTKTNPIYIDKLSRALSGINLEKDLNKF